MPRSKTGGGGRLAVAHFADQFDADLDGVLAVVVPGEVGFADRIDEPDGARRAEIDRDHAADRPKAGDRAFFRIGKGRDRGARAVAAHDVAEDALVVLCRVAPFLRRRFSAGGVLQIHDARPALPSAREHRDMRLRPSVTGWCRKT